MVHEGDSNTNCGLCPWNSWQKSVKDIEKLESEEKSRPGCETIIIRIILEQGSKK